MTTIRTGTLSAPSAKPASRPEGAVPIELKAGGISIHHVRLLHGSAPNRSSQPRQKLLLFQYCAIDAWPLMSGEKYWDTYIASILRGEATNQPRLTNAAGEIAAA